MGKICVIVLFLLISGLMFVAAEDAISDGNDIVVSREASPSTSVSDEDVEKLQGMIDQLPFNEEGETDFSKYKPFTTRAEERIDAINNWLDNNAGWMRYLFHMRPQVSILFAFNVYFILFFFLILVLNAQGLWFFIETENRARIFGGAVFVIFASVGLYAGLAYITNNFVIYIWDVLIPASMWIAIIGIIVFILLLVFALPVLGAIIRGISQYRETKKKAKQAMKMATNTEAMDKMIGQVTNRN